MSTNNLPIRLASHRPSSKLSKINLKIWTNLQEPINLRPRFPTNRSQDWDFSGMLGQLRQTYPPIKFPKIFQKWKASSRTGEAAPNKLYTQYRRCWPLASTSQNRPLHKNWKAAPPSWLPSPTTCGEWSRDSRLLASTTISLSWPFTGNLDTPACTFGWRMGKSWRWPSPKGTFSCKREASSRC